MKATRPLQSCARYPSTQPSKQQLYISSNHPRSAFHHHAPQPLSIIQTQQFSSTHTLKASKPPARNPTNKFLQDLIRDTRASETVQQQQQSTTTASAAQDWAELISAARKTSTNPQPRASASPSALDSLDPTLTVNRALNSLETELYSGPQITLRLRPTLGRTVDGLHGDPTRGFRQMERKCTENNVKGDFRSQEKHIRRGQRRKNVRILRWRRLFMEGFKKELDTVQRMRRQGW